MGKLHVRRSLQRLLACAVLLLAGTPAFAQFERSAISGTIRDQQGGVMPGVTVTATNIATGVVETTVTDDSGFYTFSTLLPGQYNFSAELQGFKKSSRTGLQADAAGRQALDFVLETGELSEEVTVTAEAARLQTDVALRKTVEAKDIEQLSFNGRNPIGVAGLKAGVSGGSFNNYGFSSLVQRRLQHQRQPVGREQHHGGRRDGHPHPLVGRDRRRAERGRAAGGAGAHGQLHARVRARQRRADPHGHQERVQPLHRHGGFFYRDESLQANTWARNRSTNATENSGPAPFDFKQYSYAVGGPILKNKLFFFGAQEWVNFFQEATNTATVPTMLMRQGNFSELLDPNNGFVSGIRLIIDPLTGQPFPGNIIPANRLSANGLAFLNTYPEPTAGFRQGSANLIQNSPNPQDQRKDNIRLDYRRARATSSRTASRGPTGSRWTRSAAASRSRAPTGSARTSRRPRAGRRRFKSNWVNEFTFTYSRDDVFIDVYEGGDYQRSRSGINYPYVFSGAGQKEIDDKIPTISISNFSEIDGGPYPAFSSGPIYTWQDVSTLVRGRHTFKAGVQFEYSGQDDFDQINVSAIPGSTNNQNGRFEFQDSRAGGTGTAVANVAHGAVQQLRRARRAQPHQVAVARGRCVRAGFVAPDGQADGRRRVPLRLLAALVLDDQQHRDVRVERVQPGLRPDGEPDQRPRSRAACRYNGLMLPGDGFLGEGLDSSVASDPGVRAPLHGPATRVLGDARQRLRAARRRELPVERQDRDACQRGHVPQPRHAERLDAARRQRAVPAAGDDLQRQRRQPGGRGRQSGQPADRRHGAGPGVQAPDVLHLVDERAARDAVRLHRRRGLRRAPRQLPAARAQPQPVAARHDPGQPRRQHRGPASLRRATA